jgi:superfamily II DNA or RNA helicase
MLQLRPYQADAFSAVFKLFDEGCSSCLVVHPTGTGKTVLFGSVAKCETEDYGGRVLVLAHRDELIQQAANSLAAWGLEPAIEKADDHAMPRFTQSKRTPGAHMESLFGDDVDPDSDPKIVIASVQTLQGKRLKAWPPGWFSMVICDEAHHATADSYRTALDHLAPAKYLGVTATADRGDGTPIVGPSQVFQKLAHEFTITEAVEMTPPALSRPWAEVVECDADISKVRTRAGDLSPEDLAKAIGPHVEEMSNGVLEHVRTRNASILFAPTVAIADAFASAFNQMGVSAMSVSGQDVFRADIVASFRAGTYKIICNCQLLTEGFDAPFIDTVIVARPTKSRGLFSQMIGRGTRLYPGKKDCLILGYDWKTMKHKLVHPVEIFNGPGLDPLDMGGAKLLIASGKEKDVLKAVRRAEEERKERERLKVKAKESANRGRSYRFDPLAVNGDELSEAVWDRSSDAFARKATEGQIRTLEKFGYKGSEVVEWSMSRAGATLDAMIGRAKAGLATKMQVELLKKFGVPNAANLKIGEASAIIGSIARNGWRFNRSMIEAVPVAVPERPRPTPSKTYDRNEEFIPF